MDSTSGTVIEETVFTMDISQRDILKFTRNYVHGLNGPLPSNAVASTIDDSVDFHLSGVSVISTAKDEEILKLPEEIACLKEEQ